jgi:hypothetical protein
VLADRQGLLGQVALEHWRTAGPQHLCRRDFLCLPVAEVKMEDLTGHEFEDLVEVLLNKMGLSTEGRKPSADGGIDIVAHDPRPIVGGKYIIQCKRYTSPIAVSVVRDLYGVVTSERASKGILVTNSRFTREAEDFAGGKPIELVDGDELRTLMQGNEMPILGRGPAPQGINGIVLKEISCPRCHHAPVDQMDYFCKACGGAMVIDFPRTWACSFCHKPSSKISLNGLYLWCGGCRRFGPHPLTEPLLKGQIHFPVHRY